MVTTSAPLPKLLGEKMYWPYFMPWMPFMPPFPLEIEIAMLEQEKAMLEARLAEINKRLEQLKGGLK